MDLNSLRTQVFEKTGIKIDTNDPVFALVALNEAVLSDSVERHISALESASARLQTQTTQLIEAGERTKKLLVQLGQAVEDPAGTDAMQKMGSPATLAFGLPWRWIGVAGAISILSALLVVLGQVALGYPRTPTVPAMPVTATVAPTLTAEQILLIQNGEKYARMWPKLDPKTQEKIRALSQ
jgi:hypothetical protein